MMAKTTTPLEAFGLYSSFDAAMRGNEHRCGKKSPTMAIEGDEAKCSKISQRDGGMINIEAERFFNNHDGGGDGGGDFGFDNWAMR